MLPDVSIELLAFQRKKENGVSCKNFYSFLIFSLGVSLEQSPYVFFTVLPLGFLFWNENPLPFSRVGRTGRPIWHL